MICVQLDGGLGNQLFQYAVGRALSLHHKTNLLLDVSNLKVIKKNVTSREFELNHFKHSALITDIKPYNNFKQIFYKILPLSPLAEWTVYREKCSGFDLDFSKLPDYTYLKGYWQSWKYFEKISNILEQEIIPNVPLSTASLVVADRILSTKRPSVAVHIRRGDYVSLPSASAFHGTLSLDYYNSAITIIREHYNNPQFYIFSDDPKWCIENIREISGDAIFVGHNLNKSSWEDLVLMSYCRNSIIANSSFSWWSAWLADQRLFSDKRIVIAPQRWFNAIANDDMDDRLPAHWQRI